MDNVLVVVGVIAGIIQAVYAALTYHNTRTAASNLPAAQIPGRHLVIMLILAMVSWISFGADMWSRHKAAHNQTKQEASDSQAGGSPGTNISGTNCTKVGHDCVHVEGDASNLTLNAQNVGCKEAVRDCVDVGQKPLNPLHGDAIKWRLSNVLLDESAAAPSGCEAVIVRYQVPYAEIFAQDLKDILRLSGWKYHEVFAAATIPQGMSLLNSFDNLSVRRCSDDLRTSINNLPNQKTQPIGKWDYVENPTEHMKLCSGPCVEISIGNEPTDAH